MHKFKPLYLFALLSFCSACAEPLLFQNSQDFSSKNVEIFLKRFVQEPHPMGSPPQRKLAQDLQESLSKFGLKASIQKFESLVPNLTPILKKDSQVEKKNIKIETGYNVVGVLKGNKKCAVIFGGHYDTKYFQEQYFIGANDGGSSTALLLELARIAKRTHFDKNALGSCSLYFVFFDGEESFLPNWNDAKEQFNIQDNLYGSRSFVKANLKKKKRKTVVDNREISLVFILDMIGHRDQNLFITEGSDSHFLNEFIHLSKVIKINKSSVYIDDDHVPFFKYHVPILHVIDWTNLYEWHTHNDNLNIISYEKISKLGESIVMFLKDEKREE